MLIGYSLVESDGGSAGGSTFVVPSRSMPHTPGPGNGSCPPSETVWLHKLGCEHVFSDIDDDRRADRPGLRAALEFARRGDVIAVTSLGHLGADVETIVRLIASLSAKGVTIRLGDMAMDMMIPSGEALAFTCRALSHLADPSPPATNGVDSPRRRGRPQSLSDRDIAKARRLLANGSGVPEVARALGVSPATVYRIFPRRIPKPSHPDGDAT